MISIDPALLIVAIEVGAAIVILLLVMTIKIVMKRRRDNAALRHLVDNIKGSNGDRKTAIESFLKDSCHYDEENVAKFTTDLLQAETALYRQVIDAAFTRKKEALAQIINKTEQLVSNYRALTIARAQGTTETNTVTVVDEQRINELAQETERLSKEIAGLKEDNEKLNKDLSSNEAEMDRLIAEYSSAFRHKPGHKESDGTTTDASPPLVSLVEQEPRALPQQGASPRSIQSEPLLSPWPSEESATAKQQAIARPVNAQTTDEDWPPVMNIDAAPDQYTPPSSGTSQLDERSSSNPMVDENIENLEALDELLDLTTKKNKK